MSFSSFLLKKAQDVHAVDSELDELFKSKTHAAPPRAVVRAQNVTNKKRKLDSEGKENSTGLAAKKTKTETKSVREEEDTGSGDDSDSDESVADQECPETEEQEDGRASSDSEEDENEPFDPSKIIHESLQKSKKKSHKPASKKKYIPQDETPEQRDLRTVFVGNLSVEVAKKRPLQKQLRRLFLSAVPAARIESIRFRSVAFKDPTVDLTVSAGEKSSHNTPHGKEGRQHDKARAAAWRHPQSDKDTNESKDEKKFLTPNQKKKIAFINQEFHSVADTVHAYVVFAHPAPILPIHPSLPSSSTTPEPKSRKEAMDPYEAAQTVARQCDGTNFMDRLLRVDVVGKSSARGPDADPKLTIFVGNLDFASKEEDLRVFFEGVVSKERGAPPPLPEDEEHEEGVNNCSVMKEQTWVTRVRIVRDRETQLGKGFAYIQFADRECVDEILALEEGKLKFAKRKLRVQRCKTIPGSSLSTKHLTADNHKSSTAKAQSHLKSKESQQPKPNQKATKQGHSDQPPKPIIVPKGDPKLGDKLAHLSKEDRKRAKSADADRVARRLAKKKARMAIGTKHKDQASGNDKKRVRVRKSAKVEPKKKKGRVRSEASITKLNAKK
ncbi:hypothetical protein AX14_006234 [Amanita brunnescens Koide BX004]|nr:hypothetical protein AX14_006234 [Amanita brunnescens Koide BX004]